VPPARLSPSRRVQLHAMALNPRTIEHTELDLDNGTKLLAAAIAQAGAEIALAIAHNCLSE
jgi:hypothetical protein